MIPTSPWSDLHAGGSSKKLKLKENYLLSGSIESSTETSHVDSIPTSGQITNSIDPKTLNQETKSQKRKRPVSK